MSGGMRTKIKARKLRLLGQLPEGGLKSRRTMGSSYKTEVQGKDFLTETSQESSCWAQS